VEGFSQEGKEDPPNLISLHQSKVPELRLCDLWLRTRKHAVISSRILTWKISSWKSTRRSFWQIQTILKQKMVFELRVVDDTAERGVALMQEYMICWQKIRGSSICSSCHQGTPKAVSR